MYIEFDILAAGDDFATLERSVESWALAHGVPFSTKVAKGLKYRLGLNHPEHFTLFFMTWQGPSYTVKNPKQS
jgi:hypothetical protein